MDLSRLPPELRAKLEARLAMLPDELRRPLEARLAKLPAHQLEQVLAKGEPMIERLAARASAASPPPTVRTHGLRSQASYGHFNKTVQRGDPPVPWFAALVLIVAGLALLAWRLGWLS